MTKERRFETGGMILIALLILWLAAVLLKKTPQPESVETMETTEAMETTGTMEVHFIDVGQGDATLVKSDGHYMLIDAGSNSQGTKLQLYLNKQGVDRLDYLILTHPDADHIGGADVIVTKYDIDTVFFGDFPKEDTSYRELMEALEYKSLSYMVPKVGNTYTLGSAEFTILAPNAVYDDANNSSIALLLKNGDHTFLFTGDCGVQAEADIMANGLNIDCDVYKLGHHGSRTSSSREFLEAVTPAYGVISCGENDYGHPHEEPLAYLEEMGGSLFRTDEQGSIVAYSDGKEISFSCGPGESRKAQTADADTEEGSQSAEEDGYIIANKNSKVFHRSTCKSLPQEKNRVIFETREEAIAAGFDNPCDNCKP
ncbi:MAG: MBL fold metallo-hydrolase [Lachnospiraceae bacterium]|nr:MBL fold metallo-hydrolase [Lachnospiraceae bacterium]